MNRIFVISDTHFGHAKIIKPELSYRPFQSIEEHDRELVARWNSVVKKKDTVWHLGDVFFDRKSAGILGELNGIKKLVLGNHDTYPVELYLTHFRHVFGSAELKGCILTHVPVHPMQFARSRVNIHGHLHDKVIEDDRYINVCAERTGYAPVLFDELIRGVPTAIKP